MPKKKKNTNTGKRKTNSGENKHTTPQDKYKHSAFTAAQDLKYTNYRNRTVAKGEKPLPKREWYEKIHKSDK